MSLVLESGKDIKTVSIYGDLKLSTEVLDSAYVEKSKIRARDSRFFKLYGPGGEIGHGIF